MKFLRAIKEISELDKIKNEDIRKELDISPFTKENPHVLRMPISRIQRKVSLSYNNFIIELQNFPVFFFKVLTTNNYSSYFVKD